MIVLKLPARCHTLALYMQTRRQPVLFSRASLLWLVLAVAPMVGAQASKKNQAEQDRQIIVAQQALGDGLPQVAAVKAEQLLAKDGLSSKEKRELAGLAVEGWARAGEGQKALDLLARYEVQHGNYWRAFSHALVGDLAAAEAGFSKYQAMGELADEGRLGLAHVLMAQGRGAAARRELDELRENADANVAREARLRFNELELTLGRNQKVLDRLAREQSGKDPEVQFLRARGLLQLGDLQKAEAVTLDLLASRAEGDRMHEAATVLLAEIALKLGRADSAMDQLSQLLDRQPETVFIHEAFDLLNRCRAASRAPDELPIAVVHWCGDLSTPTRQACAQFWLARWLNTAGRKTEAQALIESLLPRNASERLESDAMRLALEIAGDLRADARVFDLAKMWREKYGGGGESLVDFISGGIFYARGDFKQALEIFRRSADLASDLLERRRALYNAAIAALRAGEAVIYQSVLAQLHQAGGPEAGAGQKTEGSGSADLELGSALQLAAKLDAGAELALEKFITTHAGHPRLAEAHIAHAELALLDVPPRVKDAETSLKAAAATPDLNPAQRERLDYVSLWVREAEGDLRAVTAAGLAFLKQWPESALAPQVAMKTGEAYYRLEDYANARTQFELLANEHPSSPHAEPALFFAGRAAMELGTPEGLQRAIAIWGELAERGGSMAFEARFQQALAKRREGREQEALKLVNDLLEEKIADPEMQLELRCQRIELQLLIGRSDPKTLEIAAAAAREIWEQNGLSYLWRGRVGALLAEALQGLKRDAEALTACHDVVKAGLENVAGPANAAEFHWFYWAGFRAVSILESQKQWEAAAKMAETLAQTAGDRAADAKKLANEIRMEHFLWDEK